MYGATRRACSGSGCGRSLLMLTTALLLSVIGLLSGLPGFTEAKECDKPCMNGQCNTATGNCVCFPGWVGDQCQHCGGRFRYSEHTRQNKAAFITETGCVCVIYVCFASGQVIPSSAHLRHLNTGLMLLLLPYCCCTVLLVQML